jgi:hypothetical protein
VANEKSFPRWLLSDCNDSGFPTTLNIAADISAITASHAPHPSLSVGRF